MRPFAAVLTAFMACTPLAVSAASPAPGGSPANAAFVAAAYQVLLGRQPDTAASQVFLQMLAQGANRSAIVNALINSAEFRQAEINALYQHFLNRGADQSSLNTFGNMLAQGATIQQVAVALVGSPEYFAQHGDTNTGFVQALYQSALGRPAGQNELNNLAGQLSRGGATRAQVSQAIIGSSEGTTAFQNWFNAAVLHGSGAASGATLALAALAEINAIAPPPAPTAAPVTPQQAYVDAAYRVTLGRPADHAALASFSALLSQGMSHTQLVQDLENGAEFSSHEVDFMYEKFLGRHADGASVSTMSNMLSHGATSAQIVILLVSSDEYFIRHGGTNAGFIDALYMDVLGRHADKEALTRWTKLLAGGMTRTQFATTFVTDGTSLVQDALIRGLLHGSGASSGASLLQAALTEIDNAMRPISPFLLPPIKR